jgi:hypothetical protein
MTKSDRVAIASRNAQRLGMCRPPQAKLSYTR